MYHAKVKNLMNVTKDKALSPIVDDKKQIHMQKDQKVNTEKRNLSMNFWGQGSKKDDLSFFDLNMVMNY